MGSGAGEKRSGVYREWGGAWQAKRAQSLGGSSRERASSLCKPLKSDIFTRLADGTFLIRQEDGSFHPVRSETDRARLEKLTELEIERMAATDPDHPALDEAFWESTDVPPITKEAISIKLDADVLAYFRGAARGYQTRINPVLRRYMEGRRKQG